MGVTLQFPTWFIQLLFRVPPIQCCLSVSVSFSVDFGNINKLMEWWNEWLFHNFLLEQMENGFNLLSSKAEMDLEILLWISYSRKGQRILVVWYWCSLWCLDIKKKEAPFVGFFFLIFCVMIRSDFQCLWWVLVLLLYTICKKSQKATEFSWKNVKSY